MSKHVLCYEDMLPEDTSNNGKHCNTGALFFLLDRHRSACLGTQPDVVKSQGRGNSHKEPGIKKKPYLKGSTVPGHTLIPLPREEEKKKE